MSLDISFVAEGEEVFTSNITHNLTRLAKFLGIYGVVWRPAENEIERAEQMVAPLERALAQLKFSPNAFGCYEPENKWGTVKQFIPWLEELLEACREHPAASVESWR